jgi:signal transduction histidine kinase
MTVMRKKAGFQKIVDAVLHCVHAEKWLAVGIFLIGALVLITFSVESKNEKIEGFPQFTISVVDDLTVFDRGQKIIRAVKAAAGGRSLVLLQHSSEITFEKSGSPRNGYALKLMNQNEDGARLIASILGVFFGQLIFSTIFAVGMLFVVCSMIDGRPFRDQLKSRLVRITLAFYFFSSIAIVNWPVALGSMKIFLLGFGGVVVMSDVYKYVASGVGTNRPKIFFTVGSLVAVLFLMSRNSLDMHDLSAVMLIIATAMFICELATRAQFHYHELKLSFTKFDWVCALCGGFLLLAWRDIISQHYVDAQTYSELSMPVQTLLVPTFWFPFIWIPISIYLLRLVIQTHRTKIASLNAYSEKLLKSIQERELQINLAHYDDLRRQEQEATEAERQTIYRDLHDGIGSKLVAAMYSLRSGRTTKAALEKSLLSCLSDIKKIMNADELQDHRSVQDLFFDYCFTMDDLLSESGVTFAYKVPSEQDFYLIGEAGEVLIKMSQEIVTNSLKHSPARSIFVELKLSDEEITIFIQESSYDFESMDAFGQAKKISSGAGLSNLKLRALEIGVEFSYEQLSDERRSYIFMKLIDQDVICLSDGIFSTTNRRRQFLINQIGELS